MAGTACTLWCRQSSLRLMAYFCNHAKPVPPFGARCLGGVRRWGHTLLWQVQVHCTLLLAFYVGGHTESPSGRRWPPPAGRTPRAGLGPLGPLASWGPGPRGTRGNPFGPLWAPSALVARGAPRRATFGPRLFNPIHYRNLPNAKPVAPFGRLLPWWRPLEGGPTVSQVPQRGKVSDLTIT